jgi:septal ring factor EnvC (AmiA/AmiB activator)
MPAVTGIRRRLSLALLLVATVAVTAAVASYAAAPQAEGPPGIDELTIQVAQLSDQIAQLSSNTTALSSQIAQVNSNVAGLDAKLTQVDSRTIDISQDIQLLKQLANSTHDRLTAVCRNVNYTWGLVEIIAGVPQLSDVHNCWRNYYAPGFAATFSSRWTDPIP